ncbi:penicillin-binding transpeptidase domain-containing protein [Streptomyces sp. GC420]|uniref:penicillin-binding transpeptidase domain-containing protein n=1 Tax=Streptomyces sp. GC420 TaxID=2697568 RepID=UPI0014152934|nr:penicillin-binding transpeptidase domain-containing protein [Streptomyces sp. GC420]NBM21136.1 penicillin-binding protein [Streptomyces sp. GC420]
MRGGTKAAIVGGAFVVVLGGAGYGAYNMLDDVGITSAGGPGAVKTGPPSAGEVEETSREFLEAWAAGDAREAADLTNNAEAAQSALAGYAGDAHIEKVRLDPGPATGAKVPYSVTATVSYGDKTSEWSYESELTVVRGKTTGRPLVDWLPSVIHPELKEGEKLAAGEAESPPIQAVDRNGKELTKEKYPSLGPILDTLRERYGDKAGGTPGIEVWAESATDATEGTANRTLHVLSEGKPGKLPTTLDAGVQAAAEKAVKKYGESSVVAIRPSTGEIRAVANNRKDGFNAAMQGALAPGSTMKIVSAAMLLDKGLLTANGPAECPKEATWQGRTFTNLDDFSTKGETFAQAFARSCNTAFIKLVDDVEDDSLAREARDVFGIGLDWKTGIASVDGSVPESSGPSTAAALIGQGQVQMNPLTMASVTATAKQGVFKQPVIVPPSLDDRELAQAARPLSASTAQQLRDMMRLTATSGTGTKAMAPVGGDKGAKTGSAEVDGQSTSNSWFTGFSDDLAAAAVVQQGGHGGDAAGPVVAAVLNAD